jgi:tetratricopeptide (TPR) repeat protein
MTWLIAGIGSAALLGNLGSDCPPPDRRPSPGYLRLVTRYASGERAAAVAALGEWTELQLKCELNDLRAAAAEARRCGACVEKLVFRQLSLRAAVLLHADREAVERLRDPADGQPSQCGRGMHGAIADSLLSLLIGLEPEAAGFSRRFYLGMALRAHRHYCLQDAEEWARNGLRWSPTDGSLHLAAGTAAEAAAFITVRPAPLRPAAGPRLSSEHHAMTAELGHRWGRARRAFEEALASDPALHEARLRLGRVLWRLGRGEPARDCFERVLGGSGDPSLVYLAHLFLGRVHEDAGRLAQSAAEYRAALGMRPSSQVASVALSHALQLLGDAAGARELLAGALEQAGRRDPSDPYWAYVAGRSAEAAAILDALRLEASR